MRFDLAELSALAGGTIGLVMGLNEGSGSAIALWDIHRISEADRVELDSVNVDGATNDTRQQVNGRLFVALRRERDGHDFLGAALGSGAAAALVDKEFARAHRVSAEGATISEVSSGGLPVVVVDDCDQALFRLATMAASASRAVRIGVTGSSGKTTTKDMLVAALSGQGKVCGTERSLNNEIGLPLTILNAADDCDHMVLEMAMRTPGDITKLAAIGTPSIGVITNIGSGHLGVTGGLEAVAQVKRELLLALPADGTAVLNADDERCVAMAADAPCPVVWFGRGVGADGVRYETLVSSPEEQLSATRILLSHAGESVELRLPAIGVYQAANAAAAVSAAIAAGVGFATAARDVTGLKMSPLRMHVQVSEDGLTLIDDTYNANPESMAGALRTLAGLEIDGRRVAILGQMHELGDDSERLHEETGRLAARLGVDTLITVGEAAAAIAEGALAAGMQSSSIHRVSSFDGAADIAIDTISGGDAILIKASRAEALDRVAQSIRDTRRWR